MNECVCVTLIIVLLSDIMRKGMHRATSTFDYIIVQYMYYQYEEFQSKVIISKYFSDVFCTGVWLSSPVLMPEVKYSRD